MKYKKLSFYKLETNFHWLLVKQEVEGNRTWTFPEEAKL